MNDVGADREPVVPPAIDAEIESWDRVFNTPGLDDPCGLLSRAAGVLWDTWRICSQTEDERDAAVGHQAVADALHRFSEIGGIDTDTAQAIIVEAKSASGAAGGNGAAPSELPLIVVEGGTLHLQVRAIQRALIGAGAPVFFRGGCMVTVTSRIEPSPIANKLAIVTVARPYSVATLRDVVSHAARFERVGKKGKQIDPPKEAIATVLELAFESEFLTLGGIIDTPTMRPDASLLTRPGYDRTTKLFYRPAGDIVTLPPMPERPTKEDAIAALQLFKDLLAGFPFSHKLDLAVAIAAILTVILRGAFDRAPMFLFVAPEPGTGKTYLVRLLTTLASGRDVPAVVGSRNPEEMEKRIGAAAFDAPAILHVKKFKF
jgi:putative DNA primase/helicase